MNIGVFNHGWWKPACDALSRASLTLPIAEHPSGNAYAAHLGSRITNGETVAALLPGRGVGLLIDNGGTGLGFVRNQECADDLKLAHEVAGTPLCSHFIDPVSTTFQGLDWRVVWQSLQSRTWLKAVWDRAHARELQNFGIPNVIHLPMAAPDRVYDTRPLDPSQCRPLVSFVGGQNTSYFAATGAVPSNSLLAGTLTQAIRSDLRDVSFYDAYHDVFELAEPVDPHSPLDVNVQKTLAYFNAKLFYHASLCIRNRDRFVIFLKRRLGDTFELRGSRWDTAYGLPVRPRLATSDDYFNHFREVAINLNLVNGNAESGLNMRHFEITAAGGFMLCYQQPELGDHFQIGKECAVFSSETDLLEKTQYYLRHPDERIAIAQAGQRRTLGQHLYSHRLKYLLEMAEPKALPVQYSASTWSEDCKSLLPMPDVILDCGANVGQMAAGFRQLYPQADIYSFEPVKAVFEKLRGRAHALHVHPVHKAVGDRDGRVRMNLTTSPEANSLLAYQEGNPCAKWTGVIGQEEVEVCTLDRWCAEQGISSERVDILKLDVQGAELQALYGARKLLERTRLVYVEVSFVPIYKDCPLFGDIESFMKECGYRRYAVYPSDQPQNWGDALYVKGAEKGGKG